MGIPIICNAIGDTGNIIAETKTGLVVNDFFSVESLQQAVVQLPASLERLDKQYIRQCAKDIFDSVGVKKSIFITIILAAR